MKTLKKEQIHAIVKISKTAAINLVYSTLLLEEGKIYTNRGNNASATINWLKKEFGLTFETGNDAPRGGKVGNFAKISNTTPSFEAFKEILFTNSENAAIAESAKKKEQAEAVRNMVISENEKNNFLTRTFEMSNRQARKIAHNCAARKLGFYSNEGMNEFMKLR